MLNRVLSQLARIDPVPWYPSDQLMRMQLVQYAIDRLGARTYLEIGVDEGPNRLHGVISRLRSERRPS